MGDGDARGRRRLDGAYGRGAEGEDVYIAGVVFVHVIGNVR
jgi:hypothetical protein